MTVLDRILVDVEAELGAAKARRPLSDIKARLADAPPVRSLAKALAAPAFSLIAEIKERSPSVGAMRWENVREAPAAYEACALVSALSILTNHTHFGGSVENLARIRNEVTKPVLRKDFLLDEYQVREARAFGADAILLMANVLDAARLAGFYDLARELGMDALFEVHTEEEIALLPPDARIIGINSRKFRAQTGFAALQPTRDHPVEAAAARDFSVDLDTFALVAALPRECLKVAESGLSAQTIGRVADHFDAALVGTSLLRDERGVAPHLEDFAAALAVANP
jgi:indole-3-glycerol phosphate synthase